MTPHIRRLVATALVVFFVASPAQALIPDPVEAGLLKKIARALEAIQDLRMRVMARIQQQTDTRINAYAFPTQLFRTIQVTTTTVTDMRRELQRLACDWPMSVRTRTLSALFSQRTEFCRAGYQAVWGSHEGFWDSQLQEANDYVATMTANSISERVDKTNRSWVRAHKDLFDEEAILRRSPGEASRAEAAALAWANEVAIGNSQIATHHLLVRQMGRAMERLDQKKADDVTYLTYQGLTTLSGGTWTAPADPSETPK